MKTVLRFSHAAAEQARQAAAAEHAQAELARESDRAQNAADMLHQQRQVQTQRTQEWLQLAQKTHVAFFRLFNLFTIDFNQDIYDTVLASAPPDPAFAKGRQMHEMTRVQFQKDTLTPQMLEAFANDENGYLVDDGVVVGSLDRNYGRNTEGHHAGFSFLVTVGGEKLPYVRLFRESLLESMAAEPDAPLARRFRMYVEHRLMPAMAELAELLHENGSLLEWPAAAEMAEMFPYIHPATSREMLMFLFRSHYQAWCAVLTVYGIPRRHPYSLRAGVAAKACPT